MSATGPSKVSLSATLARSGGTIYLDNFRVAGVSDTTVLTNAVAAATGKTLVLGSTPLTIEDLIEITADHMTLEARGAPLVLGDGSAEGGPTP